MNLTSKYLSILILSLLFSACTGIKNSQYYEYLSTSVETPECLLNYSYSTPIKLTGTAKFFKRGVNLVTQYNAITSKTDLKNLILGNPLQNALPIRFAEVVVRNSKYQIVQCGRTNQNGEVKAVDGTSDLLLPAVVDSFNVQVLSRIYVSFSNSFPSKPPFLLNVSVKKDKYTNKIYTLEKSSVANGRDDISVELIAYARQTENSEINGGAFNILNSIYAAYSYLSLNTNTIDIQCLNTRINSYWKAGFNPFQYLYPQANPNTLSANSYYNSLGDKTLNISGGRLGNTSLENTDHFDDFVIIHELGHFIEDNCGQLLSPGGIHYIASRIDPRLAWSEGWANFFAAQVMYNNISELNPEFRFKMANAGFASNPLDPYDPTDSKTKWSFLSTTYGYSDTSLNIDNGTGIMFDLKKPGTNPDTWQEGTVQGSSFDKVDPVRYIGEGHFREGAITRGFFKLANLCGTSCTSPTQIQFSKFWEAIFDRSMGMANPDLKFAGSHFVLERVKAINGWSLNLKNTAVSEALHLISETNNYYSSGGWLRWIPYGQPLLTVQVAPCTPVAIEPRSDDSILTLTNSDQRYSNHFYTLDLSLIPGVDQIDVAFNKINPSGTNTEFDILLFQEGYKFNGDYACPSSTTSAGCVPSRTVNSDVVRSDRRSGLALTTKRLTDLASLDPTKKYLLNIRAYTASRSISTVTDYGYQITFGNGPVNYLCP